MMRDLGPDTLYYKVSGLVWCPAPENAKMTTIIKRKDSDHIEITLHVADILAQHTAYWLDLLTIYSIRPSLLNTPSLTILKLTVLAPSKILIKTPEALLQVIYSLSRH